MVASLAACAPTSAAQPIAPTDPRAPRPSPTADIAIVAIGAPTAAATAVATAAFPSEVRLGEHLSSSGSYTQTETEAAGPMLCRIERDSCAFRLLVSSHDPAILFSGGETPYGDEDRMMHPAMLLPLARLSELVAAEWGSGVQLLVTEAYDSLLDHNVTQQEASRRYSLHFEGRSIDLITWPPDAARMGRLCALGLQAGFDYVHNEGDHCHASIRADSLCAVCSGSP